MWRGRQRPEGWCYKPRTVKGYQAKRGQGDLSPVGLRENMALLPLQFWTSQPPELEIYCEVFCCSKPLTLWFFVTKVPGNQCSRCNMNPGLLLPDSRLLRTKSELWTQQCTADLQGKLLAPALGRPVPLFMSWEQGVSMLPLDPIFLLSCLFSLATNTRTWRPITFYKQTEPL